jgi:uncharacterized protein YndB with AHSA1/START domain
MTTQTVAPVTKSITVNVPQQRAFEFFVEHHAEWWPMEGHTILEGSTGAAIEPREGGRWWEYGGPKGECDWGRVLAYEPPERLLLAWQLDRTWSYDPDFTTEVEVRFVAEGESATRVEIEHRNLERFGDEVGAIRASFDSDNGWSGVLRAFADHAG